MKRLRYLLLLSFLLVTPAQAIEVTMDEMAEAERLHQEQVARDEAQKVSDAAFMQQLEADMEAMQAEQAIDPAADPALTIAAP